MKETNMEHYRGEIERIISIEGIEFAPAVVDGKPVVCEEAGCKECLFKGGEEECAIKFIKWLMSEYKPEPVLTAREKHFVEFAQEGWLARDEEGSIDLHISKPYKNDWYWDNEEHEYCHLNSVAHNMFRFITWEDEEPWAVADLRKLKALEYNPEDVAFKGGDVE